MGGEDLVAVIGVICVFGLPTAAWMFSRLLRHRERMAMYQHGIAQPGLRGVQWTNPAPVAPPPSGRSGRCDRSADTPDVALRKGVGLSMIGLALTIGLSFIMFDGTFHPGPWLLGGLVPLFIGLSNILIALLSGATLGQRPFGAPPYAGTMPPPPGPGPGPGVTYDGSYTYRPGDHPELSRPSAPPDRR